METTKAIQKRSNSGKLLKKSQAGWTLPGELTTIDGLCISVSARAEAIRRGAGVMIGDYFVGVTTGSDMLFSEPVIVY